MAVGYQYYEILAFPDLAVGEEIRSIRQNSMFSDVDDEARTIIRATGLSDHSDFLEYYVVHESPEKVKGRYQNAPITGYIAEYNFHLFRHKVQNILLVDARQKWAREMVDRFQKTQHVPFDVATRKIDLPKLGSELRTKLRGGWFGSLRIADVSTIGLFGYSVGESDVWEEYEQIGILKSIDIEFESDSGAKQIVKIGPTGSVVLYSRNTDQEALQLVMEIQELLNGFICKDS